MAIELKLLIDKDRKRVAFAESNKNFVDTILSFLTETVGNVVRLSNKKSNIGCTDALYESVENLDSQYFQTKSVKDMLLHPRSASEARTKDLVVNIDAEHPTYYICTLDCAISRYNLISSVKDVQCCCGNAMGKKIYLKKSEPCVEPGEEGVFLKGNMRFMITDDLLVHLVSVTTCFTHLSKLGVSNWTSLEAKSVNMDAEQAFHLLKQSLVSNTPLSDVFLPEVDASEHAVNVNRSFQDAATDRKDDSEKMRVKLIVSKSRNKVLFAEVNADFVDLLFSFLTFPLGSIVKLLGGGTFMPCLDNLYKSVDELSVEDSCLMSEECSTMLLEPKLALHWQCESQILPVMEENPVDIDIRSFYCTCCRKNIQECRRFPRDYAWTDPVNLINPKISGGTSMRGGGFVKGPKTAFLVTDGLDVKPMSLISGISILEGFNVPFSDLQEHVVSVGEVEVI